jgi:hypothetical protein
MIKKIVSPLMLLLFCSNILGQSDCVRLYGDVSQDGVVNVSDLMMLANALAGNIELSPAQFAAADVYYDGVLSAADLYVLANYLAGNEEHLPMIPSASTTETRRYLIARPSRNTTVSRYMGTDKY